MGQMEIAASTTTTTGVMYCVCVYAAREQMKQTKQLVDIVMLVYYKPGTQ